MRIATKRKPVVRDDKEAALFLMSFVGQSEQVTPVTGGEPRTLDGMTDGFIKNPPSRKRKPAHQEATNTAKPAASIATGVTLTRADKIAPEAVAWLWRGWIARGKVHVVAGAPGTGKTTAALSLVATLTTGGRWPDGSQAQVGDALIWSGEDSPQDTLIPRLIAAGADRKRVHIISGFIDERGRRPFDPATDIAVLSERLAVLSPPPMLLVIDPLVSAIAGDSHKNAEVRRALQPLVELAQVRGVAVYGISHFSKGTQGRDPTERVTGSLAFGALARVVMATAKLPEHEGCGRILVRVKSNLGPDSGGFGYDLEEVELDAYPGVRATRVLWGAALEGTARDLLGRADAQEDDQEGEEGAQTVIECFVRACLAGGPVTARQMQDDAKSAGYLWHQVKNAATRIGVERSKEGFKGGWSWSLRRERQDEESREGNEGSAPWVSFPSFPSGVPFDATGTAAVGETQPETQQAEGL